MADIPSTALSALAAACLVASSSSVAGAVGFGILFPAALATQNVLPILWPPLALFLWLSRKEFPRSRAVFCGAVLLVAPLLVTLAHRHVMPGATREPYSLHTKYLGFQLEGLVFYPWVLVCLLGPCILLLPFLLLDFVRERPAAGRLLLVGWFLSGFTFFALFYRFFSNRFALFFAPPLLVGIAWSLRRLMDAAARFRRGAALLPVAGYAWFALLTPPTPYRSAISLAPDLAVMPVKPAGVPRDPSLFEFGGALHVDRSAGAADFAWRYVARPERAVPAIESQAFSIREVRELVALGKAARVGSTVAVVDDSGPAMFYFESATLRAPLIRLGERPDGVCDGMPGAGLLLVRRGLPSAPCFVPYLSTGTFQLLRRVVPGS